MAQLILERHVKVSRTKLLETLRKNLAIHEAEYRQQVEGFKTAAEQQARELAKMIQESLEANLQKALNQIAAINLADKDAPIPSTITIVPRSGFSLEQPKSYAEAFHTYIQMLEWETEPFVELNGNEFKCLVQNEWAWRKDFDKLSRMYNNSTIVSSRP